MLVFSTTIASRDPEQLQDEGFLVISVALLLGMISAVATGWLLTKGLDDPWRRGVTSALSVFGTALLSIVTMPIHSLTGSVGLAVYLALLLFVAIMTHRAAYRAKAK